MTKCHSGPVPGPMQSLLETGSMAGMTDRELVGRFAAHRDAAGEAAFAVLVARHGPMVLGVCRHLLGDDHDADDAFQAVFLVLARRAGSIRRPELLGPWLHGVATRIARNVRKQAHRRRRREKAKVEMTRLEPAAEDPDPRALRAEEAAAVHEEIGRLPERYRRAVVLCHLEGLTHAEAARRLGCAPGTVGSLVSRARDMLRSRLTRRGLSAGAIALAASMEPGMARAAVPMALERAPIRAASLFATGPAAVAGFASASALELAGGALNTMTLHKLAFAGSLWVGLAVVATASGLVAGILRLDDPRPASVPQQARKPSASAPAPSLPGAVTQPPPWLDKVPFDAAAFFAAPPPEENAAPRYLDALFEFGSAMAICFPEGPDRESRKQAAERRLTDFSTINQALRNDPNAVPAATIDAMLDQFDTGFRKLDWAQQRPRCVFETGISITSRSPHVIVANQVARVARLKVRRELERGQLDAALRDLSRLMRLSRDLLPRGVPIAGMVSASIDGLAVNDIILPMLAAPGLTVAYCDRILALLTGLEARSVDAYTEGMRADYLTHRATLHDLVFDQDRLRKEWAALGTPAGPSIVVDIAEPTLFALAGPGPFPRPSIAQQINALAERMSSLKNIPNLDAQIARTSPEELSKQVDKLNELFRGLLSAADANAVERIRGSTRRPRSMGDQDVHTRVTRGMLGAITPFTQSVARSKAMARLAEAMVAIRRWQLRHGGNLPPSLDAAAKEAGLPAVPVDPYDGRPIRFAVVDGRPTVYAVGQDGRDDGGRTDNLRTPDSGDVLLRLPGR